MTDAAYERAVREHRNRVFTHAVWVLRDREEAADAAQEAMVRLWQHRSRVEETAVRGWLLTTVHRLALDRLRRRAVRGDGSEPEEIDALPGQAIDPERAAASALACRSLEAALAGLSPRDRAIVVLREIEGFAYEEIAAMYDLPMGTLKAALHRTREKLRVSLLAQGVRP